MGVCSSVVAISIFGLVLQHTPTHSAHKRGQRDESDAKREVCTRSGFHSHNSQYHALRWCTQGTAECHATAKLTNPKNKNTQHITSQLSTRQACATQSERRRTDFVVAFKLQAIRQGLSRTDRHRTLPKQKGEGERHEQADGATTAQEGVEHTIEEMERACTRAGVNTALVGRQRQAVLRARCGRAEAEAVAAAARAATGAVTRRRVSRLTAPAVRSRAERGAVQRCISSNERNGGNRGHHQNKPKAGVEMESKKESRACERETHKDARHTHERVFAQTKKVLRCLLFVCVFVCGYSE